MRKRILAIFLCLILTLSLAAAVAAEDFTVTLPPGSNFLPPNRPEQPEPDDEDRIVTLQIPITKVVELGGNTAPKQTTFSFYAFPSDPSYGRYEAGGTGLWDVQNCTVSVNGAGTFGCVMTIQIDRSDFFALTDNQGIFVVETNDEQSGWTYDETRWFLQPQYKWSDAAREYKWTGGWDCYNKFEAMEGSVHVNPDNAQGGLGFVNLYTENTAPAEPAYKPATLNKTDHFAFLKGYPGGGFAPGKNMSRAEVTTMFARLLTEQMEANKSYPASFSDVTSAHWAANYIGYMEQFGIVRGYSNGTFRPNAPITRAEFAAICCRFEQLTDGAAAFTDVPASHWAAKSIAYPYRYTDWYLPLIDAGKSMPDAIGEDAPEEVVPTEGAPLTPTDAMSSGGDGIVTEEQVQKGYVWMNEVNNNIFDATYEDIVAYFGVEGQFVKEEYSDHMKANYRYYKWISEDDDSHFIYVNFKENESGVYTVSAYNTSGFSGTEAIEKYLDIVKAEAAEANKAASANAEMKDFSVEIAQFAKDDVKVKIMTKIPVSGWSFDDGGRCLVENDDPTAFGAGAIRFEVRTNVEDFDYYKDKFENYQDIEDRVIGGITFRGRTYKYIGYNWIQYVAQIDDGRALSIGLTKLDCVPGTMPDIILNNMTFQ